ncbi:MAG: hypothetical protein J7M18_06330, partial [Candidatus Eremiobacteraeota bacterium]|nr:hypothetical protein [Candidatus Eremiobacteraeota bacterium]
QVIMVILLTLIVFCIMAIQAESPPDIYILNRLYDGPVGYKGGEIWVSLADVLPLMDVGWKIEGKNLDITSSKEKTGKLDNFTGELLTYNGKPLKVRVINQDGILLVSLYSLVRDLGFKYRKNSETNSIDVFRSKILPVKTVSPPPPRVPHDSPDMSPPGFPPDFPDMPPSHGPGDYYGDNRPDMEFPISIENFNMRSGAESGIYGKALLVNVSNEEQEVKLVVHIFAMDGEEIYQIERGPFEMAPGEKKVIEDLYWANPSALNVMTRLEVIATDPAGNVRVQKTN